MSRRAQVTRWRDGRRSWRVIALAVSTAIVTLLGASAVASAAPTRDVRVLGASRVDRGALVVLFAKQRGLPAPAVAGVRPGTLHVARIASTGREWAIAGFRIGTRLSTAQQVRVQGGGDSAVFTRRSARSPWRLVAPGVEPLACDATVPASVRAAWHLAPGVRCGGSQLAPRTLARLRSALARRAHALRNVAAPATGTTGTPSPFGPTIASIALGQVGESDQPVSTNFGMDCDPYTTLDGPVYAGPSYRGCEFDHHFNVENENEEWCSDFAEWVWRQAGITADMSLINPGARSFYDWGQAQGEPLTVDGTDPQVGDAVVFYEPGAVTASSSADHVGIVTGVHPNGNVDLVDGDFDGPHNISVQYNANVDLSTWASQVWSAGEQWVYVTPPTGAQPANPTATMTGPHVVAADTNTTFSVSAAQTGGSVQSIDWSFGLGNGTPAATATGAVVHHVFTDPGPETVTAIVTSSLGTSTVETWNVDVDTPSSTVASTPSEAVYYNDGPVAQRLFSVDGTGALSEESYDGASWLDEALPGSWAPNTPVTSLDDKVDGTLTPHVFGRSAGGGLQEATLTGSTWTVTPVPGSPMPGGPIAAADLTNPLGNGSANGHEAVFFLNTSGQLVESFAPSGTWQSSTVSTAPGLDELAVGTVTGANGPAVAVYATTSSGALYVFTRTGAGWTRVTVPNTLGIASGSGLAATDLGTTGPGAYFVDRAGHVARVAMQPTSSTWNTAQISAASIVPNAGLQATNDVTSGGMLVPEVAAVSTAGAPVLISHAGGWSTQTLPGSATSLLGLGFYPSPGAPQTVLFSGSGGVQADTAASGTGPWTQETLPTTVATFPDRVLLYAADPTDLQAAQTAAQDAGLPASQVTGDFATAWADGVSGDYLVLTVGDPATTALYYNACGWTNPSGAFAGSTPFSYLVAPTDTLPGADLYLQANGASASDTATLAQDLAYYAANGTLPSGVTTLPTQEPPSGTCAGSPTAG